MTYYPFITLSLRTISVRCVPLDLKSKTRRLAILLLLLTWIFSFQSIGVVSFALPLRQARLFQVPYYKLSVPEQQHLIFARLWRFTSQLIGYARAWSSYECFILRAVRLSNKFPRQEYVKERMKLSLRKLYSRSGSYQTI